MRVVLADHILVFRTGVASILERYPGITVAGEASDAASAVMVCAAAQPHACLLAADLPGGALKAAARIRAASPGVRVILVVEHPSHIPWFRALGAPADGYLARSASAAQLLRALSLSPAPARSEASPSAAPDRPGLHKVSSSLAIQGLRPQELT